MNLPIHQKFYPEVVRVVSGNLTGSGFMLDPSVVGGRHGIGVTNAHVLGTGARPHIFPIYANNERVPVTLLALCHEYDVAFFQIPEPTQEVLMKQLKKYDEKYDAIPSFKVADVSQLKIGDRLTVIGHPLGFQHQEFSFGRFKGAQDFGNHMILYTDTELNGGNSGGVCFDEHGRVVGIASLKMTGHNIDNLNGIRPIDEAVYCVPQLLQLLDQEDTQRVQIAAQYQQQMNAQRANMVAAAAVRDVDDAFLTAFKASGAGGKVRGEPRSFHIWCKRHVFDENKFQPGGEELLRYVMEHVHNDTVSECTRERVEKGGWVEMRESFVGTSTSTPTSTLPSPQLQITFQAKEIHLPRFGLVTHPLHVDGEIVHYGHEEQYAGGVRVSAVLPASLYEKAGGHVGDIIHAVTIEGEQYQLNWQGRSEPVHFGMTLSLDNLLKGAPYGGQVTTHVLRPGGVTADLSFQVTAPTAEELPHVRRTYPNTAAGAAETKQVLDVAGMKIVPLRQQHVEAFQMASLMHPEKQFKFQAVVVSVDPSSPAYGLIHEGMRIQKIGDEEVAATFEGFFQQMKHAMNPETASVFRMQASHEFGTPVQFSIRM